MLFEGFNGVQIQTSAYKKKPIVAVRRFLFNLVFPKGLIETRDLLVKIKSFNTTQKYRRSMLRRTETHRNQQKLTDGIRQAAQTHS